jgi:ornithine cyclodeaminase
MRDDDILIVNGHEVDVLLAGRELELMHAVRRAYEAHGEGSSSLPHSTFLRFPHDDRNRIIALPAYLGGEFEVAGIKWISSFPENLNRGLERASAVMVLNSAVTGRPEAILEASLISAKRTAAGAALAAGVLTEGQEVSTVALIGTGLINYEVARFLLASRAGIRKFLLYDLDPRRSEQFGKKCRQLSDQVEVEAAGSIEEALGSARLISLATTAVHPHIASLSGCMPGATVLHVSLRDISPEAILACDNIVDDVDHVCRAQTSVHLAEQLSGGRDFIRCRLADILNGSARARRDAESVAVFSPFGLGVLDLAVAQLVRSMAIECRKGTTISSFFRGPWDG